MLSQGKYAYRLWSPRKNADPEKDDNYLNAFKDAFRLLQEGLGKTIDSGGSIGKSIKSRTLPTSGERSRRSAEAIALLSRTMKTLIALLLMNLAPDRLDRDPLPLTKAPVFN